MPPKFFQSAPSPPQQHAAPLLPFAGSPTDGSGIAVNPHGFVVRWAAGKVVPVTPAVPLEKLDRAANRSAADAAYDQAWVRERLGDARGAMHFVNKHGTHLDAHNMQKLTALARDCFAHRIVCHTTCKDNNAGEMELFGKSGGNLFAARP
eukprot:gene850-5594_t